MFDLGDELTIESYRIPWLIWIQILVLLLLMLLLFGFTLSVLDLPEISSSSSSTSSSSSSSSPDFQFRKLPIFKQTTTTLASQIEEKQSIKGEIDIDKGTSRKIVRGGGGEGEESVEMEGSSTKEANQNWYHHPCDYIRLAFLKCFGLDFLSSDNNSSITEQRKQR